MYRSIIKTGAAPRSGINTTSTSNHQSTHNIAFNEEFASHTSIPQFDTIKMVVKKEKRLPRRQHKVPGPVKIQKGRAAATTTSHVSNKE